MNQIDRHINRVEVEVEPKLVREQDGTFTLTQLNVPGFKLRRPINPVFEDTLPGGRVQISDEYSNVVVIGQNPAARISYRNRLVNAASTSPEAIPQIARTSETSN